MNLSHKNPIRQKIAEAMSKRNVLINKYYSNKNIKKQ